MDTHKHKRVRVAVDAMGGDHAPAEVVGGAVQAVRSEGVEIILVGPEERLRTELATHEAANLSLYIHHTSSSSLMESFRRPLYGKSPGPRWLWPPG
jgi:fatty acid/phospholipid biosynthesis enzyme